MCASEIFEANLELDSDVLSQLIESFEIQFTETMAYMHKDGV